MQMLPVDGTNDGILHKRLLGRWTTCAGWGPNEEYHRKQRSNGRVSEMTQRTTDLSLRPKFPSKYMIVKELGDWEQNVHHLT